MHFFEYLHFVRIGRKTQVQAPRFRCQIDGDRFDPLDVLDAGDQAGCHDAALIFRRQLRNLTTSPGVVPDMSLP
jgi:hypothetical protein